MKILFVCLGNICRSAMAERVARRWFAEAGVDVELVSAGTSSEEAGNPMDPRAARLLRARGYDVDGHVARQITVRDICDADLVLAAEQRHVDAMRRLVPDATNLRLLSEYDPQARPGEGLPDPWYGDESGFEDTLAVLEREMPQIIDAVIARS